MYTSICYLFDFSFPFFADALASANACIASLEAELNASQKAFDVVTAAKANAEKSHKSALAKAKKAEKDLADANKEHLQESKPWLSGSTQCLLLLEVHTRLVLFFCCCCFLADTSFSYYFSIPFIVQNLPSCLCQLCNRVMILLWPRLT
jgi:hypothetical protein